jgi:hypothetical protein
LKSSETPLDIAFYRNKGMVWTEFRSGSISDCPAITVPPTATIIATSSKTLVKNIIQSKKQIKAKF